MTATSNTPLSQNIGTNSNENNFLHLQELAKAHIKYSPMLLSVFNRRFSWITILQNDYYLSHEKSLNNSEFTFRRIYFINGVAYLKTDDFYIYFWNFIYLNNFLLLTSHSIKLLNNSPSPEKCLRKLEFLHFSEVASEIKSIKIKKPKYLLIPEFPESEKSQIEMIKKNPRTALHLLCSENSGN